MYAHPVHVVFNGDQSGSFISLVCRDAVRALNRTAAPPLNISLTTGLSELRAISGARGETRTVVLRSGVGSR